MLCLLVLESLSGTSQDKKSTYISLAVLGIKLKPTGINFYHGLSYMQATKY